ncbi:MAG: DNA topoisomerase VI subunit B [Candidatus Micrarchaeota archaeon]|nr:DNA topoisomerase VI subunit B [Candidatus Micrarchaeota archaeon]
MFEDFREYSVAEFFKKNRHMLGFSGKIKSMTTIIHELVTNALDACEEAQILPDIRVEISQVDVDKYKVVVSDNGPGIPKELLGKVFGQLLAGTKFHKYKQQRGQQGIGAAGVAMYAKLTTGLPLHIISAHEGKLVSADITVDIQKNQPLITNLIEDEADFHGTIVEGVFGDVKVDKSEYSVLEYIKRTAIANPHASFELVINGEQYSFPRTSDKVPPPPKEVKPHPLGVLTYELIELAKRSTSKTLKRFFVETFERFSTAKVQELEKLVNVDLNKSPKELTWQEAEDLVKAIRSMQWMAPRKDVVYPIGEDQIKGSLEAILKPEIVITRTRDPKIYRGGIPYVVEVGIAYGGNFKGSIMRFANRVPLLFDSSACAITKAVKSIDWKRYGIKDFDNEPVLALVSLNSVFVPYVSAGKTAISQEEEIVQEIKNALMEAARKIKIHINKKIRSRELEKKKSALMRYVNYLSHDISYLSGYPPEPLKENLERIIKEKYSL